MNWLQYINYRRENVVEPTLNLKLNSIGKHITSLASRVFLFIITVLLFTRRSIFLSLNLHYESQL